MDDRLDVMEAQLLEAMERFTNAIDAVAYQLERWAERLKGANDGSLFSQN